MHSDFHLLSVLPNSRLDSTECRYLCRDAQQNEIPIYRKVITAQGGPSYLYGWLMTLVLQFIIEVAYLHEHLTVAKIGAEFFDEVLADLFSVFRFSNNVHNTSWTLWILIGGTSLAYTLWLAHRSPAARRTLFGETKYRRVTEERTEK